MLRGHVLKSQYGVMPAEHLFQLVGQSALRLMVAISSHNYLSVRYRLFRHCEEETYRWHRRPYIGCTFASVNDHNYGDEVIA